MKIHNHLNQVLVCASIDRIIPKKNLIMIIREDAYFALLDRNESCIKDIAEIDI